MYLLYSGYDSLITFNLPFCFPTKYDKVSYKDFYGDEEAGLRVAMFHRLIVSHANYFWQNVLKK